jgi:hypothetical protein
MEQMTPQNSAANTQQLNKANQLRNRQLTQLVRSGLMKPTELPQLKIALARQKKVGDIARLSKQHRDVLQKYNSSLANAAYGSTTSLMALRRNLMQHYDVTDIDQVSESTFKDEVNPPPMMVLKRKGIRIFPDGRRVALYTNDKLGIVFTIPYKGSGTKTEIIPGVQAEETEVGNFVENIEHIKDIVDKKQAKKLKFLDGGDLQVDHQTAHAIHLVHNSLNDENKAKVAKMLSHSKGQFMKVADFALKNTAYKINK